MSAKKLPQPWPMLKSPKFYAGRSTLEQNLGCADVFWPNIIFFTPVATHGHVCYILLYHYASIYWKSNFAVQLMGIFWDEMRTINLACHLVVHDIYIRRASAMAQAQVCVLISIMVSLCCELMCTCTIVEANHAWVNSSYRLQFPDLFSWKLPSSEKVYFKTHVFQYGQPSKFCLDAMRWLYLQPTCVQISDSLCVSLAKADYYFSGFAMHLFFFARKTGALLNQ